MRILAVILLSIIGTGCAASQRTVIVDSVNVSGRYFHVMAPGSMSYAVDVSKVFVVTDESLDGTYAEINMLYGDVRFITLKVSKKDHEQKWKDFIQESIYKNYGKPHDVLPPEPEPVSQP